MTFRFLLRRALLLLLAAAVALVLAASCVAARGRLAAALLSARPAVPLRFTVLSRGDRTISARFFLYDAEDREIAAFERSWNGSELNFESVVVPVSRGKLVFPSRVFADSAAPRIGTGLFPYYDRSGEPAIFHSAGSGERERRAYRGLFAQVKLFGGQSGAPARLRDPEVGPVYALRAGADGTVEIVRE